LGLRTGTGCPAASARIASGTMRSSAQSPPITLPARAVAIAFAVAVVPLLVLIDFVGGDHHHRAGMLQGLQGRQVKHHLRLAGLHDLGQRLWVANVGLLPRCGAAEAPRH